MAKRALITGITGQDGSYLAELLLAKDYEVYGIVRRSSSVNTQRIEHLLLKPPATGSLEIMQGDLGDTANLKRIIDQVKPHEVYNLAAQSHVRVSFDVPEYTSDVTGIGALRLLEAIRISGVNARFYQASSSEMYGKVIETPQTEETPFYPRSPYAAAKVYAYWITVNYRESYGIHASNGILFNHESPRRGEEFVTRKITRAVGRIKHGLQDKLFLGNIEAKRDWGHAADYVEGMWRMLQQDEGDDYVLSMNETHSVREFLELAFGYIDLDYNDYYEVDPRFYRPTEVDLLLGDSTKARTKLGWQPQVSFKELVESMVERDLKLAEQEKRMLTGV